MQPVLAEAHRVVLERHLEPASPADLALWSLRGLTALDSRLSVEQRLGQLVLLAADRVIADLPIPPVAPPGPPAAAAPQLAATLAGFYDAAWRASPRIRESGTEAMLRAGFEEVFNHLDPYSRYVTPLEASLARQRRVGQSGLGLRLAGRQDGSVVISEVTEDGPAALAGLRRGDRLLEVDGIPVSARDLAAAALLLEGPVDTEVRLRIARGRGRPRNVVLVRSIIPPHTVLAERREEILWVRLTGFSSSTDRDLAHVLADSFRERAPRGVVLDLRGNRGGLLSQAVAVADAFLPAGEVARTEGRHPESARLYQAGGIDLAAGRPVVVMVDGRTASAAEIVAAALGERRRAVLVGSATMGKGLIQLVAPMPNAAELLVTWSRVLAPSGFPIQPLGVLPGVCTSLGPGRVASALARLEAGQETEMATALARLRLARAPVPASEVVALRDSCPPAEGREGDLLAARRLIETPEAYAAALRQ